MVKRMHQTKYIIKLQWKLLSSFPATQGVVGLFDACYKYNKLLKLYLVKSHLDIVYWRSGNNSEQDPKGLWSSLRRESKKLVANDLRF